MRRPEKGERKEHKRKQSSRHEKYKGKEHCLGLPPHLAVPQNYSNEKASKDVIMYITGKGKIGTVLNIQLRPRSGLDWMIFLVSYLKP